MRAAPEVNFRAVFERSAAPCLLLASDAPRFSVVTATQAYVALARSSHSACAGSALVEVLSSGGLVTNDAQLEALQAALHAAIDGGVVTRARLDGVRLAPEALGASCTSWWVVNTPVLSPEGDVSHVLSRFEPSDIEPHGVESDVRGLLAERTRELSALRADLDAFSSAVAHDLRAPLRTIDGFSHALLQDHAPTLAAGAVDYLVHIRAGAQRMSALLDDMLELSRIQRMPLRKATLDVSALAQRIVDGLRRSSPERVVNVEIAPGLRVHADACLTTVLLEKLLGNAWKFTSKKPRASIQLGRESTAGETALFVADDGIGFDMASAERLFLPFRRLHKASDFEGTGMGLAIAHRIVARHGGRIWADATLGQGARFHWTVEPAP